MRHALTIALLGLTALVSCSEDESTCEELLDRCEACFDPDLIAVCEARRKDRDQVRCSLALDDVRAACGTDAGLPSTDARVPDALPTPVDMSPADASPMSQ